MKSRSPAVCSAAEALSAAEANGRVKAAPQGAPFARAWRNIACVLPTGSAYFSSGCWVLGAAGSLPHLFVQHMHQGLR
jgi:hypothetical protein